MSETITSSAFLLSLFIVINLYEAILAKEIACPEGLPFQDKDEAR